MPGYSTVGSNKLPEALAFYDALLGSIGIGKMFDHPSGGRIYAGKDGSFFGVLGPYDGQPATVGNGSMTGFPLDSEEKIAAFHAKALELGGTCDGAPGPRGPEGAGIYFAYVRDLDGNKLCAYKFG
ncbi:VOC family protein [Sphingobium sp. Sx8-8]|uniref:VOC family protein n=1 Tax=Sphingobium sp. Sx8-8 TaxID=2933617 RepID=UPI001F571A7A|nr:VOC family protein [Sphingobium sp. Sx8-8]